MSIYYLDRVVEEVWVLLVHFAAGVATVGPLWWHPSGLKDAWDALDGDLADAVLETRQAGVDLPDLSLFPLY